MATVFTVGHSVHEPDEFLEILHAQEVELLVDVRRYPASRRVPHFNSGVLAETLGSAGIAYRHDEDLGGRREPAPDSPNGGWRNDQFRGYADHMAHQRVPDRARAARSRPAPDGGDVRGGAVDELPPPPDRRCTHCPRARGGAPDGRGGSEPHRLTEFALVGDEQVTYPPVQGRLEL